MIDLKTGLRVLRIMLDHDEHHPIKATAIEEMTGIDTREVSELMAEFMRRGFPVCFGTNGFHRARDEGQFRAQLEKERGRAIDILMKVKEGRKNFRNDFTLFEQQDPDADQAPTRDPTFEQFLLAEWGREGRQGWAVMQRFVDLARAHGWEKIRQAVTEAAKHNKKSLAYVEGILKPKPTETKETYRTPKNEPDYFCLRCNSMHAWNVICPQIIAEEGLLPGGSN